MGDVLKSRLLGWISFGTEKFEGPAKRRIVMTNILVMLITALAVPHAILFALYDAQALWIPICLTLFCAVAFQLTPLLHASNPYAGGLYNLSLWLIFATTIAWMFSARSGVHFYLLAGATTAIAIFGIRQNPLSILSIFLGLACFIIADRNFEQPAPFIVVSDGFMDVFYYLSIPTAMLFIFCMVFYGFKQASLAEEALQKEYEYSEALLSNMLPGPIAAQLKRNPGRTIADSHEEATILFADIVGFTPRASHQSPDMLVKFLNQLFTRFDDLANRHGLEKIKTLGDAFMVAGGMPEAQPDHAERVARMALDMVAETNKFAEEMGENIELRIGIHTGPVVAGVIGTKKPFYDVWGDTVNTAARLETFGTNGKIQVTAETKAILESQFDFEERGKVSIKGKGDLDLWYLEGMR
ncbi:adenylate/guanylate cyclase domain-containing protein [Neptunicoccus cionae]|uniref:adenylate/guanylate cyclase domain-containing protein n=1 Tax=Neptunicoccus cionae TaxID=2035344 RepID=UPI000C756923|nr:adenylate/guanylate cyclase domain-containing protein [Amylibacter cionae]PLS21887.1 guanylate cyclase [Amylibacter cionae]